MGIVLLSFYFASKFYEELIPFSYYFLVLGIPSLIIGSVRNKCFNIQINSCESLSFITTPYKGFEYINISGIISKKEENLEILKSIYLKVVLFNHISRFSILFPRIFDYILRVYFESRFFKLTYRLNRKELKENIEESPYSINLNYLFENPSEETYIFLNFDNIIIPNKKDSPVRFEFLIKAKSGKFKLLEYVGRFLIFNSKKEVSILMK